VVRMTAALRSEILPPSLPPIGLNREEAAAFIGVSTSLFDEMVKDARMPGPRLINSRTVWDREEVYLAFKALPHRESPALQPSKRDWSLMK